MPIFEEIRKEPRPMASRRISGVCDRRRRCNKHTWHGRQRGDLDLLILDTEQNKRTLVNDIRHRWPLKGDKEVEFLKALGMWRSEANGPFRGFDFVGEMTGLDTIVAIEEAAWLEADGLSVPVLSTSSLIENKVSLGAAAQQKDIDDVAALRKLVPNSARPGAMGGDHRCFGSSPRDA